MKSYIAIAVLTLSSMTAFAQTPADVPPTQPAAGNPGKFVKPALKAPATTTATTDATTTDGKPLTKAEKAAARKAKRTAKVGDKPIN